VAVNFLHFLILFKIVPYHLVWGGRLKNDMEMYIFEVVSISVNIFLSLILIANLGVIKHKFMNSCIRWVLWAYFVVFVLNTVGNVLAKTTFEKLLAIVTSLSAMLLLNILMNKKETSR
jgi:hypothetical protein